MSEHWTVYCADCNIFGPDVIRTAAEVRLSGIWPRYHPDTSESAPRASTQAHWVAFMLDHGYHDMRLVHE